MATYAVPGSYATIQAAINAAGLASDADAVIVVSPGTYHEALDMKKWPFGYVVPATIRASDAANPPIISGSGSGASQAVLMDVGIFAGVTSRPVFESLIFEDWTSSTNGVFYCSASSNCNVIVDKVTFRNCSTGVFRFLPGPSAGAPSIIRKCKFIDCGAAVHGGTGSDYATIEDCAFKLNEDAIAVNRQVAGWVVQNCSVYARNGSSVPVIAAGYATNVVVQSAPTYNAQRAFALSGSYSHCVTYGSFANANIGADGGGNVVGDPQFTSPTTGDLSIPQSSACFDAGGTIAGLTDDILGTTRPQGAAFDIGAYEVEITGTVGTVTVLSSTSIRLNIPSPRPNSDATWSDATKYTITATGDGAAVTVLTATPGSDPVATVTLTTTEHTNGAGYQVAWSGITHLTNGSKTYTGQGVAPTVTDAELTAAKTLRVTFSEAMSSTGPTVDAASYVLDSGTIVASVTVIDSTTVDLTLATRIPAASDTLTVNGPEDIAGNPVVDGTADFAVPYLALVPPLVLSENKKLVTVQFNVAPTSGAVATTDWSVRPVGPGAVVAVLDVTTGDGTAFVLRVEPALDVGATYRVEALNAANAQGPVGA